MEPDFSLSAIHARQDQPKYVANGGLFGTGGYVDRVASLKKGKSAKGRAMLQVGRLSDALRTWCRLERQDPVLKLPQKLVESPAIQKVRGHLSVEENIALTFITALALNTHGAEFDLSEKRARPFLSNYQKRGRQPSLKRTVSAVLATLDEFGLPLFEIAMQNQKFIRLRKTSALSKILNECRHYSHIRLRSVPILRSKAAQRLFYRLAFRAAYDEEFIRPLELSVSATRRLTGMQGAYKADADLLHKVLEPACRDIDNAFGGFETSVEALFEKAEGQRGRPSIKKFRFHIEKLWQIGQTEKSRRLIKYRDTALQRCRMALTDFRKTAEAGALPADIISSVMPDSAALIEAAHTEHLYGKRVAELLTAYMIALQHAFAGQAGIDAPLPGKPGYDDLFGRDLVKTALRSGPEAFRDWANAAGKSGWINSLLDKTPTLLFEPAAPEQVAKARREAAERLSKRKVPIQAGQQKSVGQPASTRNQATVRQRKSTGTEAGPGADSAHIYPEVSPRAALAYTRSELLSAYRYKKPEYSKDERIIVRMKLNLDQESIGKAIAAFRETSWSGAHTLCPTIVVAIGNGGAQTREIAVEFDDEIAFSKKDAERLMTASPCFHSITTGVYDYTPDVVKAARQLHSGQANCDR